MKTDVQIAQEAQMKPIVEVASQLDISDDELELYGKYKAKISPDVLERLKDRPNGKLVLVTAINPTPAGEGKTTTNVGLSMALNKLGKKTITTLREPSLGPCFGIKGGAAGGGYAQVVPMEDINLHFTGDFHAITSAHNLLAAMLDNHIHQGNALDIVTKKIVWKRVMDMNDRSLRHIIVGLGKKGDGVMRESGFDITVASEIMAILCLATDIEDLKARLSRMVVAYNSKGETVTAGDLQATGAMALLLPFFPPGLQWLFALLFWAPLVAAYVLLRQLDRRRRSQPEPHRRQKPPKPGVLSLARNPEGLTADVLLLAAAITLVVRMCMHISTAYFDYVLLAAVVFGAQARCVLAVRNWNTWRHQKNNKNKARRNKK